MQAGDSQNAVPPPRRRSSVTPAIASDDTTDSCRICRGEGGIEQPLFYPCKCSGSIKYVHQDCLMEWLAHSHKKYCELCKTPFRFTKLYDQSMPDSVPFGLFARQALLHALHGLAYWLRYAVVFFVWLCWLPWMIRQIWRGLFWIADGSWQLSPELRHGFRTAQSNASAADDVLNITAAAATTNVTHHIQGLPGLVKTLIPLLHPVSVLRGIVKAMWRPNLPAQSSASNASGNWSVSFDFSHSYRPPSMLSDVEILTSFTRNPTLNHALIDILEGQLICLWVVAAFILVFLIREWVINHQPLENQADAERNDPAPAVQQDDNVAVRPRRRRRAVRPLPDQDAQLQNHDEDGTPQDLVPPPHHTGAFGLETEPGIFAEDIAPPQEPARPTGTILTNGTDVSAQTVAGSPNRMTVNVESPPLARGAFDEVSHIHRSLEERNNILSRPSEAAPTGEPIEVETDAAIDLASPSQTGFTFGGSPSRTSDFNPGSTGGFTFRANSSVTSLDEAHSQVTNFAQISREPQVPNPAQESSDSDQEPVLTPDTTEQSSENDPPDQTEPTNDPAPEDALPGDGSAQGAVLPAGEANGVLDRLVRWLWHTEFYVPGAETANPDQDEVEIVENVAAEAPFVPVRNDARPGNNAEQAANANLLEPNIQDGIDLNDPNAIDDAEDLEGILELIGVEGPIAGMFQNVCFSVFLITLTLSASIWCPYIWGKIALLFLANPFGVFVRAPLYLLSQGADIIVDAGLYLLGLGGFYFNHVAKVVKLFIRPVLPSLSRYLDGNMLEEMTVSLSQNSSQRLKRALSGAFVSMTPDLPTFSMQSHHALRVFSTALADVWDTTSDQISQALVDMRGLLHPKTIYQLPIIVASKWMDLPSFSQSKVTAMQTWYANLVHDLKPLSFSKPEEIDYTLIEWTAKEKAICIFLGYCLFACAGALYLKLSHWILGLKKDEKVDGVFADTLRQAGGVLKVIVIIGIEMIVFPLYCGFMLDLALLPLFEGATARTRISFMYNSPITAIFVHWFLGTCYMFHFALFVSMCRKILRKGVLYFIRDPDDPSFHPVRDVLERPVFTQLGKIAFSACVYGSLLIVCLGGVIKGLDCVGTILPIHYRTHEPIMAFPADIVFFNILLPFILRKVEVSRKVSRLFEWWFRSCAAGLRLTNFLFGIQKPEEQAPNGFRWRAFGHRLLGRDPTLASLMLAIPKSGSDSDKTISVRLLEGHEFDKERLLQMIEAKLRPSRTERSADGTSATLHFESAEQVQRLKDSWNADAKIEVDIAKTDLQSALDYIHSRPEIQDGSYVRAPAKDSVRIPKGTNVFLEVNHLNERCDGKDDPDSGMHGKKDDRFNVLYVPSRFKARITSFVVLVWSFAAFTGLFFMIGPLLVGRQMIKLFLSLEGPPNDLYAFTLGTHVFGLIAYALHITLTKHESALRKTKNLVRNARSMLPQIMATLKHTLGLIYLVLAFGIVIPLGLSILSEFYIHIPLYTLFASHFKESSTTAGANEAVVSVVDRGLAQDLSFPLIHLFQTWVIGLFYTRLIVRILTNYPNRNTRAATAIRSIIRNGILNPDVRLATRAVVFPVLALNVLLLATPILLASLVISFSPQAVSRFGPAMIHRFSFPAVLVIGLSVLTIIKIKARMREWRITIRDEVYLIGERLHNFQDERPASSGTSKKADKDITKVDVTAAETHSESKPTAATDGMSATAVNKIDDFKKVTGLEDLATFEEATGSTSRDSVQVLPIETTAASEHVFVMQDPSEEK